MVSARNFLAVLPTFLFFFFLRPAASQQRAMPSLLWCMHVWLLAVAEAPQSRISRVEFGIHDTFLRESTQHAHTSATLLQATRKRGALTGKWLSCLPQEGLSLIPRPEWTQVHATFVDAV